MSKVHKLGRGSIILQSSINRRHRDKIAEACSVLEKRSKAPLCFIETASTRKQISDGDFWEALIDKNGKVERSSHVILNDKTFVADIIVPDVSVLDCFLQRKSGKLVPIKNINLTKNRGDHTDTANGKIVCEKINGCSIHNMQMDAIVNINSNKPEFFISEGLQRIKATMNGKISKNLKVNFRIIFVNYDLKSEKDKLSMDLLCFELCKAHLNTNSITEQQKILMSKDPLIKNTTHPALNILRNIGVKSNGCNRARSKFTSKYDMTVNVCTVQKCITNIESAIQHEIKHRTYDRENFSPNILTNPRLDYFIKRCHRNDMTVIDLKNITKLTFDFVAEFIKRNVGKLSSDTIVCYLPAICKIYPQILGPGESTIKKRIENLLLSGSGIDELKFKMIKKINGGGANNINIASKSLVDFIERKGKDNKLPYLYSKEDMVYDKSNSPL